MWRANMFFNWIVFGMRFSKYTFALALSPSSLAQICYSFLQFSVWFAMLSLRFGQVIAQICSHTEREGERIASWSANKSRVTAMKMNKKQYQLFFSPCLSLFFCRSCTRLAKAYWLYGMRLVNILIFASWNEMECACNKRVCARIFRYAYSVQ